MNRRDVQVIIVGSGVSGAIAAYELAKQNINVIVLEAGPYYKDRAKHAEVFRAAGQNQEINTPYPFHPQAPRPDKHNLSGYYIQKGPDVFQTSYERIVGGTTWHWMGLCPRFLPEDFEIQSRYGRGEDWPISYKELEPYYAQAEMLLGVCGDSSYDVGSPRSTPYPKPPVKQTYLDKVMIKHATSLKIEMQKVVITPTPQARQGKCLGSGSCLPLCPVGAKYEANTHVELAKSLGVVVIEKAVVCGLDEKNDKITAVKYLDWNGKEHKLTADYFVIAAHAIETPKILLMSATKQNPYGIANSSGCVGRNLVDHILVRACATAPEPVYAYRGPMVTSSIESFRSGRFRKEYAACRINIHNYPWSEYGAAPYADFQHASRHFQLDDVIQDNLRKELESRIALGADVEHLPNWNNRICLSSEVDALGLPRPEVYCQYTNYEYRGIAQARKYMSQIFEKIGAKDIVQFDDLWTSGHIVGTCRMGKSSNDSVVDENCRSHEHSNLYILGSSVFPTAGTANPTLTIVALVLKAIQSLSNEMS